MKKLFKQHGSPPKRGTLYIACLSIALIIDVLLSAFDTGVNAQSNLTLSNPVVPVLLSPADGAILPQPSNGSWTFDWADSSDPGSGIKGYQLYVIGSKATIPMIDVLVRDSFYVSTSSGYIIESNRHGWTWKVRAQNNAGEWSDWSSTRVFDVEPMASSPASPFPSPPPPPPVSRPTVPTLLSPADMVFLPQPNRGSWTFDWADSSDPDNGIKGYQLYVIGLNTTLPVIDVFVPDSFYEWTSDDNITENDRFGWMWDVRAQNNAGVWSVWSPTRVFGVEPISSPPSASLSPLTTTSAPTVPITLSPDDELTLSLPPPVPERPQLSASINSLHRMILMAVIVALAVVGIIGGILIYRS